MGHKMAGPSKRPETAETEAAAWHGRLGAASVTPAELETFFAWRQQPENAEAYRRVEQVWGQASGLAGDPAMCQALDDAMRRRSRSRREGGRTWTRRMWIPVGIGLVGAGLVLVFGSWTWLDGRAVLSTGVGEQRVVQLADGSSVRLDTDSRVRVRYDEGRRLLELEQGQALFTVAHDADRPFVVVAGDASVTALGTVFDVRREAGRATVVLVSGIVSVDPVRGQPRRMTAGQKAVVTTRVAMTQAVDAAAETRWIDGKIEFRDTPLVEAVAEVNRYLPDKIVVGEGVDGTVVLNGVFNTGDRDAFVSAAAGVLDLQVVREPSGSVRLTGRGK